MHLLFLHLLQPLGSCCVTARRPPLRVKHALASLALASGVILCHCVMLTDRCASSTMLCATNCNQCMSEVHVALQAKHMSAHQSYIILFYKVHKIKRKSQQACKHLQMAILDATGTRPQERDHHMHKGSVLYGVMSDLQPSPSLQSLFVC